MGTQIHAYIEFKRLPEADWESFGGRVHLDQDYLLFDLLAGGRNRGDGIKPIFPARGIPDDIADDADEGHWYPVVDDENYSDEFSDTLVMRSEADEWVSSGKSLFRTDHDSGRLQVHLPEFHHASWLSVQEFEMVLREYPRRRGGGGKAPLNYWGALGAMQYMWGEHCNGSRIVFWFDS